MGFDVYQYRQEYQIPWEGDTSTSDWSWEDYQFCPNCKVILLGGIEMYRYCPYCGYELRLEPESKEDKIERKYDRIIRLLDEIKELLEKK